MTRADEWRTMAEHLNNTLNRTRCCAPRLVGEGPLCGECVACLKLRLGEAEKVMKSLAETVEITRGLVKVGGMDMALTQYRRYRGLF